MNTKFTLSRFERIALWLSLALILALALFVPGFKIAVNDLRIFFILMFYVSIAGIVLIIDLLNSR